MITAMTGDRRNNRDRAADESDARHVLPNRKAQLVGITRAGGAGRAGDLGRTSALLALSIIL